MTDICLFWFCCCMINLSPRSFQRVFSSYMGISPFSHLLNVRIQHAKKLFKETELTISEIAYATGFAIVPILLVSSKKYFILLQQTTGDKSTMLRTINWFSNSSKVKSCRGRIAWIFSLPGKTWIFTVNSWNFSCSFDFSIL